MHLQWKQCCMPSRIKGSEIVLSISRNQLGEKIPLLSPFSLHIFPSFYCNFKCNYCLHALSNEKLKAKNFKREFMDFQTYKKCIDDAKQFNDKLKAIIFAGHGEPLMHPEIADMVAYAEKSNITERTEIVTNGALLTHELSDKLIMAGLKRLRISIQGVDRERYLDTCGKDVNFEQLIDNIRYFYNHKNVTEVYVKIIDIALRSDDEKKKFEQLFAPISDIAAIEYAIPFVKELDYSKLGDLSGRCKQGNFKHSKICSMPFYMMVLYPNGDIAPCCSTDVPCFFGNVLEQSLSDIWNSDIRRKFLLEQLNGVMNIPVCNQCCIPAFGLQQGDYLDDYAEKLKSKI